MIAGLQLALTRGHAGLALSFDRRPAGARSPGPGPGLVALLLTLPFALLLAAAAVATATHAFVLPTPGGARGGQLLALGPVLALALLAVSRVRVRVDHGRPGVTVSVLADLSRSELAVAVLALAVAGVFFGHLAADGLACATGAARFC
jgi:hypothetical protein